MELRKALPWIMSVALHAALLPFAFYSSRNPLPLPPGARRIEIALEEEPGDASRRGSAGADGPVSVGATAGGAAAGVPFPAPRSTAGIGIALPAPQDGRSGLGLRSSPSPQPAASPPAAEAAFPSAQDVLAGLPGGSGSAQAAGGDAGGDAGAPAAQIGWESTPRKLIRRRDPSFPPVLSAAGQEVECEARITVAPAGNVVRVEITLSSGYIEIDASVEAALRDYIFSRVDGRTDAVGTVRFHFRLEKRD